MSNQRLLSPTLLKCLVTYFLQGERADVLQSLVVASAAFLSSTSLDPLPSPMVPSPTLVFQLYTAMDFFLQYLFIQSRGTVSRLGSVLEA